jgi:hypothetical protein
MADEIEPYRLYDNKERAFVNQGVLRNIAILCSGTHLKLTL